SEEWRSELAINGFTGLGTATLATGPWPSSVLWGRAQPVTEAAAATPAAPHSISLIATGAGDHAGFVEELERAGHRVSLVDAAGFTESADADGQSDGRVAFFVVDAGANAVADAARQIAELARAAAAAAQSQIPLWLITCGSQQSVDGDDSGPVGA